MRAVQSERSRTTSTQTRSRAGAGVDLARVLFLQPMEGPESMTLTTRFLAAALAALALLSTHAHARGEGGLWGELRPASFAIKDGRPRAESTPVTGGSSIAPLPGGPAVTPAASASTAPQAGGPAETSVAVPPLTEPGRVLLESGTENSPTGETDRFVWDGTLDAFTQGPQHGADPVRLADSYLGLAGAASDDARIQAGPGLNVALDDYSHCRDNAAACGQQYLDVTRDPGFSLADPDDRTRRDQAAQTWAEAEAAQLQAAVALLSEIGVMQPEGEGGASDPSQGLDAAAAPQSLEANPGMGLPVRLATSDIGKASGLSGALAPFGTSTGSGPPAATAGQSGGGSTSEGLGTEDAGDGGVSTDPGLPSDGALPTLGPPLAVN